MFTRLRAKRMGVRTRLTLSHLAVIAVAMGLSGFLLLSLLDSYFLRAAEENLVAQAQIIAQALIPGAMIRREPTSTSAASNTLLQQRTDNISLQAQNVSPPTGGVSITALDLSYLGDASFGLSAQLETRIRVLDTGGTVLVDSSGVAQGADLRADALVARALGGEYASRADQRGEAPAVYVAAPVTVEGRLAGVVYLSQPLRDVEAVLRDVRVRWWLSMGIALLLSGAVGLVLSGAIARPVRHLTAAAAAVAAGRLEERVPVRSDDDLGRLSQAFNDMVDRLQDALQMQVDFVANVSHELRTPLTSVKGLIETLRDGAVDDPEVRDRFLETIEGETNRLIRLVNELLLLSRLDSDALTLRCEAVDLVQLAEAATDQLAGRAEEEQVGLALAAGADVPLAWADPDRVTQVLLNLLDNAIKYSTPGGMVTIDIRGLERQFVQIQVRDRGIGIPATSLPRVGERFYRVDKARSRSQGGSGLGLAIAEALTTAQHGRLSLESQEGQGTIVTVVLPQYVPEGH